MAFFNDTRVFGSDKMTLLTEGSASVVSLQNQGTGPLYIVAAAGENPPADAAAGCMRIDVGLGVPALNLAEWFPGVSGADRLYGFSPKNEGKVWVSHA